MPPCILHYGMPKTGSSAIQTWLLRKLDDPRFHYLNLGTLGSGNLMVQAFAGDPAARRHRARLQLGDEGGGAISPGKVRARMQRQLAAAGTRTVLLSAERLANSEEETVRAIHGFMAGYCEEIEGAGYIRPPLQFMESVYQQRLRAGTPQLNPARLYPDYRRRLGMLEQLLGASRMRYWLFDPERFDRGCVVRDFCARLDIRCGEEPIRRANDSLSLDAIRLLYAYRRFGPGYGKGSRAIRENREMILRLRGLEGPRLRLDKRAVQPVLDANRPDIGWIEERLGASLEERQAEGPGCIREEADLLHFSRDSLDWLAGQDGVARLPRDPDPAQVAQAVHELRLDAVSRLQSAGAIWKRVRRVFGGS